MRFQRQQVIARLAAERQRFAPQLWRYVTPCELDGMPYDADGTVWRCSNPATDAHETIIKRSGGQGAPEAVMQAITEAPYNLSLLCHRCHMRWGQTDPARDYLTSRLVRRYGLLTLLTWIDSLELHTGSDYTRYVRRIAESLAQ